MTRADLLIAADLPAEALSHYRIVGDPLAPLVGDPGALDHARAVFAPAPGEALPVIPLSAWTGTHPSASVQRGDSELHTEILRSAAGAQWPPVAKLTVPERIIASDPRVTSLS